MARRRLLTLTAATLAATALALPAAAAPVGDLLGEVEEAAEPVTSEVNDATGLDPVGDVVDAVEDATAPLEPVTEQAESLVDDLVGDDPGPDPDDASPGDAPAEASRPSPAPASAATAPAPADSPSPDTGVQAAGVGDPQAFDPTRVGLSRSSFGQDPQGSSSSHGKVETPQVAPAEPEPAPAPGALAAPAAAPSGPATPAADRSVFLEVLAALLLAGTATTWHRLRPKTA